MAETRWRCWVAAETAATPRVEVERKMGTAEGRSTVARSATAEMSKLVEEETIVARVLRLETMRTMGTVACSNTVGRVP